MTLKSSGPCSVPTKLLKMVNKDISIPFTDICNLSFTEGVFPEKNKTAKVVPTHKSGSTKDLSTYLPSSNFWQNNGKTNGI